MSKTNESNNENKEVGTGMSVKGSRFYKALMSDKSVFDAINAKRKERDASRTVKAKHGKLVDIILKKAGDLLTLRQDPDRYDVQQVIELQEGIKDNVLTLSMIKDEYKYTFDKEIKDDLDVEEALVETLGESLAKVILG